MAEAVNPSDQTKSGGDGLSRAMILLDCGTGEAKLYLTHQAGVNDALQPIVAVDQIGEIIDSAKASYESLKANKPSRFAEQYEDRLKAALVSAKGMGKTPVRVTVGLTAWWRKFKAEDRMRCYHELFSPLVKITEDSSRLVFGRSIDFQVETISGLDEAKFEAIAVSYAVERVFKVPALDMIMSGGKGSIQFTPFGCQDSDVGSSSVDLDMKRGEEVVSKQGNDAWHSECDVMLGQELYVYEQLLGKRLKSEQGGNIIVVVISAFYYGAKAAGLVEKEPQKWALGAAMVQLEKFLNGSGKPADKANLVRMVTCFTLLFPHREDWSNVEVVFARDWKVEGQGFRTTWSSGYFLQYLEKPALYRNYSVFTQDAQMRLKTQLNSAPEPASIAVGCAGHFESAVQWLQLGQTQGLGKVHECFSRYDDFNDEDIWQVPESARAMMIAKLKCEEQDLRCRDPDKLGGWAWFASSTSLLGSSPECGGLGVSLHYSPGGLVERTMIAVGFLAAEDCNPGPIPVLGNHKSTEWLHPVFDVGVLFNAQDAGGTVRLQIGTSVQHLLCIWNPYAAAIFDIWIAEDDEGHQLLKFAQNKVIENTFSLVEPWKLILPAVAQIWVGPLMNSVLGKSGSDPEDLPVVDITWIESHPRCSESLGWACGRVKKSARQIRSLLRNGVESVVPSAIADSFHRFHAGSGVCCIATWPSKFSSLAKLPPNGAGASKDCSSDPEAGRGNTNAPVITVSAGDDSIMIWNQDGDCISQLYFQKSAIFTRSVAVTDCSRTSSGSSGWNISILVGVEYPNREEALAYHNPFLLCFCGMIPDAQSGCVGALLGIHETERDADATVLLGVDHGTHVNAGRWGEQGSGHTDTISGIFVDEVRRRVYTVSHDKSVIMWDISGKLLSHAQGFHSAKIMNGALSDCGTFFATAGLDRACIFKSAENEEALVCLARVEHSMNNPELKRELFACEFTPRLFWEKGTPDCLILGGSSGAISVVPLNLDAEGGGGIQVIYVNRVAEVLPDSHQSAICRLVWVDQRQQERPAESESALNGDAHGPAATLLREKPLPPTGSAFHLCSTSRDMCIHTYEYSVVGSVLSISKENVGADATASRDTLGTVRRASMGGDAAVREGVRTIRFHHGMVRGASVDGAHNRLVTGGCEFLVCWAELGQDVPNPCFWTRDACPTDVKLLLTNVLVVAMQMLRFTAGAGGRMQQIKSLEPVRLGTRLAALDIDDGPILQYLENMSSSMDTYVSVWRNCGKPRFFFLITLLSVVLASRILRKSYEVENRLKYSVEALTWEEKRTLEKWHWRCQVCVAVLFSYCVVPLVTSFIVHIDCSEKGDGILWYGNQRAMDSRPDVVCFVDSHLVLTVAWTIAIILYLLICSVFDIVNMDLSSVLTVRIQGEPAFGKDKFSLRQVLYVSICEILPWRTTSRPRENIGALTPSKYTATRWFRLLMKIMAPTVLVFQTHYVERQMWIYFALTSTNILLHLYRPPYRSQETLDFVLFIQVVIWVGSANSLVESRLLRSLPEDSDVECSGYVFYACLLSATLLLAIKMKCCRRRERGRTSFNVDGAKLEAVNTTKAGTISNPYRPLVSFNAYTPQ